MHRRLSSLLRFAVFQERRIPVLLKRMFLISMFDLAGYFERGTGVAADPAQAFLWIRRAAESGHVYAMRLLTDIYLEGLYGQPPDDAKAEEWARRAHAASR